MKIVVRNIPDLQLVRMASLVNSSQHNGSSSIVLLCRKYTIISFRQHKTKLDQDK